MGEIIIRIDQETGAVNGVETRGVDKKGKDLKLTYVGDISDPKEATIVRDVYDDVNDNFGRFIRLPVELWEKRGSSVCTVKINGQVFKIC